jgi:hypothetical protein
MHDLETAGVRGAGRLRRGMEQENSELPPHDAPTASAPTTNTVQPKSVYHMLPLRGWSRQEASIPCAASTQGLGGVGSNPAVAPFKLEACCSLGPTASTFTARCSARASSSCRVGGLLALLVRERRITTNAATAAAVSAAPVATATTVRLFWIMFRGCRFADVGTGQCSLLLSIKFENTTANIYTCIGNNGKGA